MERVPGMEWLGELGSMSYSFPPLVSATVSTLMFPNPVWSPAHPPMSCPPSLWCAGVGGHGAAEGASGGDRAGREIHTSHWGSKSLQRFPGPPFFLEGGRPSTLPSHIIWGVFLWDEEPLHSHPSGLPPSCNQIVSEVEEAVSSEPCDDTHKMWLRAAAYDCYDMLVMCDEFINQVGVDVHRPSKCGPPEPGYVGLLCHCIPLYSGSIKLEYHPD